MRRSSVIIELLVLFSVVLVGGVSARGSAERETQLNQNATKLNTTASNAAGAAAIEQTIEAMFNVTADQITTLQNDNLGYGEIVILLAVAQTMPGGVTSDNISKVLAERQGPPVVGWGKIAKDMGVDLGTVVSAVASTVDRSSQALAKAQSASGNGNGDGSPSGASSGAGQGAAAGSNTGSTSAGSNAGSGKKP